MTGTINMQDMRYLNLFGKITRINTKFCLKYNNVLIFCVPQNLVYRAVGEGGRNVRSLGEILGRRIKIIRSPDGIGDIKTFVEDIVSPVQFKNIEVRSNEVILTAGSQSKASLIGRNKQRLLEMQKIIKDFFGKDFKIV